ncbi:MAG: hypothetical protein PVI30_02345 [Myxococcales bacterium]|jgi:hypothetical protein
MGNSSEPPAATLEPLERAYAAGDFRRLRVLLEQLDAAGLSVEERRRAEELRAACGVDRVEVAVLLACAVGALSVLLAYLR